MNQKIFVVEDEQDIARLISFNLTKAGYHVALFGEGQAAVSRAEQVTPALFVLDIQLPHEDGLQLCRRIRSHASLSATPIIFVTARDSEIDRVLGLELGADDYIPKPFCPQEMVARVRAVLRRDRRPPTPAILKIGDVELDLNGMTLRVAGKLVETTTTEFRIFEALAHSLGRVVTRDRLLQVVWGRHVEPRSVDVYISRLRDKIEDDPSAPRYLKTLRGIGYRLDAPQGQKTA